jgi:hypothetical protein
MAENLEISDLRAILKDPNYLDTDKFLILQNLSWLLGKYEQSSVQEIVLRLLERQVDFVNYKSIVDSIVRQVGLFPYLIQEDLGLSDTIAYEFHKPTGLTEDNIVFHSVQAEVYFELMSGTNVILSAPTSFGKSLIIDAMIAAGKFNSIAIILPTLALVDETRRRLSKFKDVYKVITHASQVPGEKNIFILTQERVIEFLDVNIIDFFVIDEFYKIQPTESDTKRSYVLNHAFYKLMKKKSQFYLLGPNIEQINNVFPENIKVKFIKTNYQTVVSEVIRVNFKKDEALDRLVSLCLELKEQTLIYCASPASANRVASALLLSGKMEQSSTNVSAVDWLKDQYHPQWILPNALDYGIGLHHGKIPRAISQYSVRAFNEGKINFLVCTSTLIEGVNTKAKNVIIYDNRIARKKFDYFTFNNISGRSGRMFKHFVGKVFIFHEPPLSELPLVDFPILSQDHNVPERVLLQIDEEDLSAQSKSRLLEFQNQDLLSIKALKSNGSIDLDDQLAVAKEIIDGINTSYNLLSWNGFPTSKELQYACDLIWKHFVKSNQRICGVSSGAQLAFKIGQLRTYSTPKSMINHEVQNLAGFDEINDKIEEILDFIRFWANFNFPNYLMALNNIQKDIFEKLHLAPGNYSFYAGQVESQFTDSTFIALDEYGIPIQIALKLKDKLNPNGNLDEVLEKLKSINVSTENLTDFEKEILTEVQGYI